MLQLQLPGISRHANNTIFRGALLLSRASLVAPGSLIPGSGRSPGEGNGNTLHYSCLENSMNRGACQTTVHGVKHDRVTSLSFLSAFLSPPLIYYLNIPPLPSQIPSLLTHTQSPLVFINYFREMVSNF